MQVKKTPIFYPKNLAKWRKWLEKNHITERAVWVVFHSKKSEKETILCTEAVDIALCFGWIDSKKISVDKETTHQYFSKRKPKSTWSKVNKQKIERLIAQDLMTEAGYASIELAKQNGSWTMIDDVEELIIPDDLEKAFAESPTSKAFFSNLSKTVRKSILQWLVFARTSATRQKRITEIIESAEQNLKPKYLR